MENYIEIGYEGFGRNVSPVMVKTTSVIEDKSLVFPRIKDIFKVFERNINPKKRDKILEKIIDNTFLLNGNDLDF